MACTPSTFGGAGASNGTEAASGSVDWLEMAGAVPDSGKRVDAENTAETADEKVGVAPMAFREIGWTEVKVQVQSIRINARLDRALTLRSLALSSGGKWLRLNDLLKEGG